MQRGNPWLRLGLVAGVTYGVAWAALLCADETGQAPRLPPKEKFRVYLLMGQSNMAGAAPVGVEDRVPHPRVLRFSLTNHWEMAGEPIHSGRRLEGMGPAFAFAKIMAEKHPEVTIGLVPCAVGGTPLRLWERDGRLYKQAIARAKAATRDGKLAGVLWLQGEKDSTSAEDTATYEKRLTKMFSDLRKDLNAPQLPIVVGQIGEFLKDGVGRREPRPLSVKINEILAAIPAQVAYSGCASSAGLKHKGDGVHFDTESQREMGRRFAAEMLRLEEQQSSGG